VSERAVEIGLAVSADPELTKDVSRLLSQLSDSGRSLGLEEIQELIDQPCTKLFLARVPASREEATERASWVVGMLTLVVFRLPSGPRAWIEDVVVDEHHRHQGIGEALVLAALDTARELGAKTVDLTSRPSREAANRLYQRLGFQRRETNVYRFDLMRSAFETGHSC
jgi:ribosomal protein S18 acetylase RimI-like enzyme